MGGKNDVSSAITERALFHKFLGNIVAHIQAKYRIDQMKTEGAHSILNKSDIINAEIPSAA